MILWIILFYIGNLLDLLSTYSGMRDLPKEEMQKRELNPVMSLFIHNKKASYIFKFGLSTIIVIFVLRNPETQPFLVLLTIMLFFVVGNNFLAYYLTKKKKLSPGKFLTDKCKLPRPIAYLVLLAVYLSASVGVLYLIA